MKLAIIGSREYEPKSNVIEFLNSVHDEELEVITGGAPGVDTWAEEWCEENNVPCEVIRPIDTKIKINYLYRNIEIITKADRIIAFWDGKSKGTQFTVTYAATRGKDVTVRL